MILKQRDRKDLKEDIPVGQALALKICAIWLCVGIEGYLLDDLSDLLFKTLSSRSFVELTP